MLLTFALYPSISPWLLKTGDCITSQSSPANFNASSDVGASFTIVPNPCHGFSLTLNMVSFSMVHTGDVKGKVQEARQTLFMADKYMENLGLEFEKLRKHS